MRDALTMVAEQVERRGIDDARLLAAMRATPREAFIDESLRAHAYDDGPLPIGEGQTISQSFIVAEMIAAARISPSGRVLEVGAGSGYAAAVLGYLAREVHGVERLATLADSARARLARLGYANVHIHTGDGTLGWPEAAPFDAIIVSAAGPRVPAPLKAQLSEGGRLVMPVGESVQRLIRIMRAGDAFAEDMLDEVRFVPLIGEHGWRAS